MLYKTISAVVYGIDVNLIEVEVDMAPIKEQDPRYPTVALSDAAVRESRERDRSALKNRGCDIRPPDTTIDLAPADVGKAAPRFDLAIALEPPRMPTAD